MAHAAFPFPAPARPRRASRPTRADEDPVALQIGLDHARHGLVPPAEHLHPLHPVRQGWERGQARWAGRTLAPSPELRAWLALRLQAWSQGLAFEDQALTPSALRRLLRPGCPVTRAPLPPPGADADPTAGLTRLNLQAGFAAGHLVRLVARALHARGTCRWDEAWRRAQVQRVGDAPPPGPDDLRPAEWARLAVLLSFATPLEHTQAARLPLRVLPPPGVRVLNPVQGLQLVLTLQLARAGYSRRIHEITPWLPGDEARRAFKAFMLTLLARRLAVGRPGPDAAATHQALEDAWAHPEVLRAWLPFALRLTAPQCEQILARMDARGLIGPGCRHLPADAAVDGWALDTHGRLPSHRVAPAAMDGASWQRPIPRISRCAPGVTVGTGPCPGPVRAHRLP